MYQNYFQLLSTMFVLGCIQLIWALFHMAITKSVTVSRHFAYYFIGVALYFVVLMLLGSLADTFNAFELLAIIHFFVSAFGLAIYHVVIVGMSIWLRWAHAEATATAHEANC